MKPGQISVDSISFWQIELETPVAVPELLTSFCSYLLDRLMGFHLVGRLHSQILQYELGADEGPRLLDLSFETFQLLSDDCVGGKGK
jgi:hypothetical protein